MSTVAPRPLTISTGGADDIDDVMRIMEAAFDSAFGEAWSRSQCAAMLGQPRTWLSLARIEDRVCGFAMCQFAIDDAELLLIAVDPRVGGEGVGRTLVEQCCVEARLMGAHRMHLEVREENTAELLYKRTGFEAVGRRIKYYHGIDGTRYDAITLARSLKDDR